MVPVKLFKIPKHIWWGVFLPLVLVGLGIWQLWPKFEEYREEDERLVLSALRDITVITRCVDCNGFNDEGKEYGLLVWAGYKFMPLQQGGSSEPSGERNLIREINCKDVHDISVFGYCAFPIEYDWRHRRTIISNGDVLLSVDNGGKPVTEWPTVKELTERFTKLD